MERREILRNTEKVMSIEESTEEETVNRLRETEGKIEEKETIIEGDITEILIERIEGREIGAEAEASVKKVVIANMENIRNIVQTDIEIN